MLPKKYSRVDLEQHRSVFMLLSLLITLGILLVAINWTDKPESDEPVWLSNIPVSIDADMVPITRMEQPKQLPPPPPPSPTVVEVVQVVDNSQEVADTDVQDAEADDKTPTDNQQQALTDSDNEDESDAIFFVVETMPQFPGGDKGLIQYIANNTIYPTDAREKEIQGKVYVRFVVTTTGAVEQISVVQSVHPQLDAEAIRVVKSMPRWKPGEQRGKKVNVWFSLPINFKLSAK